MFIVKFHHEWKNGQVKESFSKIHTCKEMCHTLKRKDSYSEYNVTRVCDARRNRLEAQVQNTSPIFASVAVKLEKRQRKMLYKLLLVVVFAIVLNHKFDIMRGCVSHSGERIQRGKVMVVD